MDLQDPEMTHQKMIFSPLQPCPGAAFKEGIYLGWKLGIVVLELLQGGIAAPHRAGAENTTVSHTWLNCSSISEQLKWGRGRIGNEG